MADMLVFCWLMTEALRREDWQYSWPSPADAACLPPCFRLGEGVVQRADGMFSPLIQLMWTPESGQPPSIVFFLAAL